jgi:hypothetical protein
LIGKSTTPMQRKVTLLLFFARILIFNFNLNVPAAVGRLPAQDGLCYKCVLICCTRAFLIFSL